MEALSKRNHSLLSVAFILMLLLACFIQQINAQESPQAEGTPVLGPCEKPWMYAKGPARMGVLKSVDHGLTWTYYGHVCLPDLPKNTKLEFADPSPIIIDNEIVLFFFEGNTNAGPTRIIGRATSPLNDGLIFKNLTAAYSHPDPIWDPYVLKLRDNTYRMYMGTMPGTVYNYDGIISASSQDGRTFVLDQGNRAPGGLPGALLVSPGPDDVRLYVSTGNIESFVSPDGLNDFAGDQPTPLRIRNGGAAHPIELHYGSPPYPYFMAFCFAPYSSIDAGTRLTAWNVLLTATSSNTIDWVPSPVPAVFGSVPGVVEIPDANGTLLLYFIDFWWKGQPKG
jgi:hypothetical protein